MFRYLKAAFFARADIPLIGPLPLNLMAVGLFVLLGAAHPAFWLLGLGLETLYLFTLGFHPRFQKWIDAGDAAERRGDGREKDFRSAFDLQRLIDDLDPTERKILYALQGKLKQTLALYGKFRVDEFTLRHNRAALGSLLGQAARLLAARNNIIQHWSAEPGKLLHDIAGIEGELQRGNLSPELISSKTRTLEILRVRLENQQKKAIVLAEIDSEVERIRQQFDLALENAAIGSKPQTVSAEVLFDPEQVAEELALPDFGLAAPATPAVRRRREMN